MREKIKQFWNKFKSKEAKEKKPLDKKSLKNGSYTVGITAVTIAVVIVVNLIVQAIPSKFTQIDVTEQKLYTVGKQTEQIIKALDQDVTLNFVTQSGNEDDTIEKLLERYKDLSGHIKVITKDLVKYPNFTSQFTDQQVSANSVIVSCGDRNKVVDNSEIYPSTIDYSSYSYTSDGFDGEGQITSAIDYVTSEDLPVMYVLQGHNEASLSASMTGAIEKENIQMKDLSLLTEDAVPEDAGCLFIFAPTTDLSSEETAKIKTYLSDGGKAMIISAYTEDKLSNFDSIMADYGVTKTEGVVFEGDSQHYLSGNPYYLIPDIESTQITSDLVSGKRHVFLPIAQGLTIASDEDSQIQAESLLGTSDKAYSKINVQNMETAEKEEGDIDGPFSLGVAVTKAVETTDGEGEEDTEAAKTQIVYFASDALLNDSADAMVSGGNSDLFMNSLSWMADHEVTVSIDKKSTDVGSLTLPSGMAGLLSVVIIGIIPVLVLITGLIIWMRRRKQ